MSRHTHGPHRSKSNIDWSIWGPLLLVIAIFIFALVFSIVAIHQEAKTFNKFKGENVPEATFWDAFFSELRVEATGD